MFSDTITYSISKKTAILNLLKESDLTAQEIEARTGYDRRLIWVYINQFKREKLIRETGEKRNAFNVYTSIGQKDEKSDFSVDTKILKKLLIPFAQANIKIDLSDEEINRIQELFQEVKKDA